MTKDYSAVSEILDEKKLENLSDKTREEVIEILNKEGFEGLSDKKIVEIIERIDMDYLGGSSGAYLRKTAFKELSYKTIEELFRILNKKGFEELSNERIKELNEILYGSIIMKLPSQERIEISALLFLFISEISYKKLTLERTLKAPFDQLDEFNEQNYSSISYFITTPLSIKYEHEIPVNVKNFLTLIRGIKLISSGTLETTLEVASENFGGGGSDAFKEWEGNIKKDIVDISKNFYEWLNNYYTFSIKNWPSNLSDEEKEIITKRHIKKHSHLINDEDMRTILEEVIKMLPAVRALAQSRAESENVLSRPSSQAYSQLSNFFKLTLITVFADKDLEENKKLEVIKALREIYLKHERVESRSIPRVLLEFFDFRNLYEIKKIYPKIFDIKINDLDNSIKELSEDETSKLRDIELKLTTFTPCAENNWIKYFFSWFYGSTREAENTEDNWMKDFPWFCGFADCAKPINNWDVKSPKEVLNILEPYKGLFADIVESLLNKEKKLNTEVQLSTPNTSQRVSPNSNELKNKLSRTYSNISIDNSIERSNQCVII